MKQAKKFLLSRTEHVQGPRKGYNDQEDMQKVAGMRRSTIELLRKEHDGRGKPQHRQYL